MSSMVLGTMPVNVVCRDPRRSAGITAVTSRSSGGPIRVADRDAPVDRVMPLLDDPGEKMDA
jgi:hypothetical protein